MRELSQDDGDGSMGLSQYFRVTSLGASLQVGSGHTTWLTTPIRSVDSLFRLFILSVHYGWNLVFHRQSPLLELFVSLCTTSDFCITTHFLILVFSTSSRKRLNSHTPTFSPRHTVWDIQGTTTLVWVVHSHTHPTPVSLTLTSYLQDHYFFIYLCRSVLGWV